MDISVVVPSWNRSQLLKEMLQSFFDTQNTSLYNFELIIVDNNSADNTKLIVDEAIGRYGRRVRYLYERKPGVSHARNAGLKFASGSIIAFLDDDILLVEGWMDSIIQGFKDHPTASCLTGQIEVVFEGPIPNWITERNRHHFRFGATNFGDVEHALIFPKYPPGANMAFRSEVFNTIEPFKPNLGRKTGKLLSCEEPELFYRMQRAGLVCYYIPKAKIIHRVLASKLNKRWIFKRFFWQGISEILLDNEIQLKSSKDNLKASLEALANLTRELFGNRLLPWSIAHHLCSLTFENLVASCLQAGRLVEGLKQMLIAFRKDRIDNGFDPKTPRPSGRN